MNISSVISSFHESNSSDYFSSNGTEVETEFDMFPVVYIISILMSFPINSYVIWLIETGTGNGLAAEIFIVNLSVCEIFLCLERIVPYLTSWYNCDIPIILLVFLDESFNTGRPLFQCLMCVERYLAVIHPVTFLKYKPLRYRLMCSAVTWGTTFVFGGLASICWSFASNAYMFFLALPFIIISIQLFCCLAVLRALKQSGPGERGREREEDKPHEEKSVLSYSDKYCEHAFSSSQNESSFKFVGHVWFVLAGVVQPVLFLYRVRKLKLVKCQYCT